MPPFEFTTGALFNAETGEKIINLSGFETLEISVEDSDAIEDPLVYRYTPKEISFTCENVELFPNTKKRSKKCKLFKKVLGINVLHWVFPRKKDRRGKRLKRRAKNE